MKKFLKNTLCILLLTTFTLCLCFLTIGIQPFSDPGEPTNTETDLGDEWWVCQSNNI